MTSDQDANRPEHDDAAQGQVSETSQPGPAIGDADATDKSTGTAPDEAVQPEE